MRDGRLGSAALPVSELSSASADGESSGVTRSKTQPLSELPVVVGTCHLPDRGTLRTVVVQSVALDANPIVFAYVHPSATRPGRNSDSGMRPTKALVRDHGNGLGFPRSWASIERYGWSHSSP